MDDTNQWLTTLGLGQYANNLLQGGDGSDALDGELWHC
jgi:hypothetical protein